MNRSTALLLGLLLVLGAIVYFVLPSETERVTSYRTSPHTFTVDSAMLARIEIKQKTKSVTLENVGGKWMLTAPLRYPADQSSVGQLTSALGKFRLGSLISSNPEKQHLFQVDTGGTQLTVVERTGKSASLIVGKMGPSFSEVYVRLPESDDVYLAQGLDSWMLNKEVRDWRDRTILTTPSESVTKLAYSIGERQHAFERDTTGWTSDGHSIDEGTIAPVLTALATLRSDDFVDTVTSITTDPITITTLVGAEERRLKLFPVPPDTSKYFVQSSGGPQLFTVNKWTAQQLLKPVQSVIASASVAKSTPRREPPTKPFVAPVAVKEPDEQATPRPPARREPAPTTTTTTPATSTPTRTTTTETVSSPTTPVREPASGSGGSSEPPTRQHAASTTPASSTTTADDDGELIVHTVKKGETMTTIAQKYKVTIDQVLKWNLLKSIAVKPGQELYIYIKR